jgi:hypothetical protein
MRPYAGKAVVAAILAVDWMAATVHLNDILIETSVDPPSVVADGISRTRITVRVTENGQPRAHDLLQIFLAAGAGRVLPGWTYTDKEGMAMIEFTPNQYSEYDPQSGAELEIVDISIGRLIEMGKRKVINIPMLKPEE